MRKDAFIKTDEGQKIQCIGLNCKDAHIPYIRHESKDGEYLGVVKDKDLKKLLVFVKEAIKGCK